MLQDTSVDRETRQRRVSQIWNGFAGTVSDSPIALSRVAGWFLDAEMPDEAIKLQRTAITLAPAEWSYHAALGGKPARGRQINGSSEDVEGIHSVSGRTTRDFVMLSETLEQFGYRQEALAAMQQACKIEPEFQDVMRLSDMLLADDQIDAAMESLRDAESMATTELDSQKALAALIECLRRSGMLTTRIHELEADAAKNLETASDEWQRLAALYDASGRHSAALAAADKAVAANPESIAALKLSARLAEEAGLLQQAATTLETLAGKDPRGSFGHLRSLADLQMKLGMVDDAIATARRSVAVAPGNASSHKFLSDLLFRSGHPDQATESLKEAVRINGSDTENLVALASALADGFETDEAKSILWQAFNTTKVDDRKINIAHTLALLYQRTGTFDQLVRLLQQASHDDQGRTIHGRCLAAAYQSANDITMARHTLERLLSDDRKDAAQLRQLSVLAEQQDDYAAATNFQRRANISEPGSEGFRRFVDLQMQIPSAPRPSLDTTTIQDSHLSIAQRQKFVDALIDKEQYAAARQLCQSMLQDDAANSRALFSLAIAEWSTGNFEKAVASLTPCLMITKATRK